MFLSLNREVRNKERHFTVSLILSVYVRVTNLSITVVLKSEDTFCFHMRLLTKRCLSVDHDVVSTPFRASHLNFNNSTLLTGWQSTAAYASQTSDPSPAHDETYGSRRATSSMKRSWIKRGTRRKGSSARAMKIRILSTRRFSSCLWCSSVRV